MKIILLPLDAYLNINKKRTYFAFVKDLKINPFSLFYQWLEMPWYFGEALNLIRGLSLPSLFDQFDKGLITPTQFRAELRNKFSALANKTDLEIDQAWNKMYIVDATSCKAFEEAKQIHNNETVFVTFYGDMNALHAQTIKEQHKALSGKINLTSGKLLLSYLEHVKGLDLIANYTQIKPISTEQDAFKKKGKPNMLIKESPRSFPAKILLVYTPSPVMPYPKLGWLSWVFTPWRLWEKYKKQNYYHDLAGLAKQNNFTLISSQATTHAPNIIQTITPFIEISKKHTLKVTALDFSGLPSSTSYTPCHSVIHSSPSPSPSASALTGASRFKNFKVSS